MAKILMKGNEVIGAAAINAGCTHFFGYPITPQNEVPEYMSRELPKVGGRFVQAESEVAAINMVYGAAGAGARVMTSSSSPGIALKQEGITYIAGAELPCVIVNVVRGGPGLGGIQPAQSDYNQSTRGGGNGDYKLLVYAPGNIQELADMVQDAFDAADYYRNPVMILADGMLGQMMEPVEFHEAVAKRELKPKTWITEGTGGKRQPNIVSSLFLNPQDLENHNIDLQKKYTEMKEKEALYETYLVDDAEIVLTAYGTTARIVRSAIHELREEGIKVGLVRPKTVWPFPEEAYLSLPDSVNMIVSVEMSMGQMVDDIRLAVRDRIPVKFYGRSGGIIPTPEGIIEAVKQVIGGKE